MTENELIHTCGFVLLVFWLLPMLVYVVVDRLVYVVRLRYRTKDMEPGVFYCKQCRFDLRGTVGPDCPECGARLIGKNIVDVAGFRRWPVTTHFVFVALLITPAIFVFVLWLLMILPVNTGNVIYRGDLAHEPDSDRFKMYFYADMARSRKGISQLWIDYSSRETGQSLQASMNVNAARNGGIEPQLGPAHFQTIWMGLMRPRGLVSPPSDIPDPEVTRRQVVQVLDGIVKDELYTVEPAAGYLLWYERDERFAPHLAAVIGAVVMFAALWAVAFRWFARKRVEAIGRYDEYVVDRGLRFNRQFEGLTQT